MHLEKARAAHGKRAEEEANGKRRGFMIAPELRQSVVSKARQGFERLFARKGS